MIIELLDTLIYTVTDWVAWAVFSIVLNFSKVIIILGQYLGHSLSVILLAKFFQVLFSDKRKKYHWTKLQKSPSKFFENLSQDEDIKLFLKCGLFILGVLLLVIAMLKSLIILTPSSDDMHFLDMCTQQNFTNVVGIFCTVVVFIASFKITQYRIFGIINSYKEFNYKMIFWM